MLFFTTQKTGLALLRSPSWVPSAMSRLFSVTQFNKATPETSSGPPKEPSKRVKKLMEYFERKRLEKNYSSQHLEKLCRRREHDRRRYAEDPKYREKSLQKYRKAHNAWYKRDEWRAKTLQRAQRHYYMYQSEDPGFQMKRKLWLWFKRYPSTLDQLPWKTHRPIHTDERVERFCQGCGLVRHGGAKLWWQRRSDPELYDCQVCYMKNPEGFMPEGYEDVKTIKELRARKEELDKLEQQETSATKTGPV